MFSNSKKREDARKAQLDELVIEALMPVFPPSEMKPGEEVAALAHCVVMEIPGWSDITPWEIRRSLGRIYTQYVIQRGKINQPVHWGVTDVLRSLCLYKNKYPELLKNIYWWGMC